MTDYSLLREQLASMTRTERDTIANLANASALLYMSLSPPASASTSEKGCAETRRREMLRSWSPMCTRSRGISPAMPPPARRL